MDLRDLPYRRILLSVRQQPHPGFGPGSQRRLASSASIAIYLYVSMKEMRAVQEPAVSAKKKPSLRKMPKESSQLSMQPPKAGDAVVQTTKTKLKPVAPSHIHPQTQKSSFGENEGNVQSHETAKNIVVFVEGL